MAYLVKLQNTDHLKESFRDACGRMTPDVLKGVRREWEGAYVPAVNFMVPI